MRTISAAPKRTHDGFRDEEGACHAQAVEPGRLDWFTSAVLPDGGQRVRICRCARSTPTEAVEHAETRSVCRWDRGTSALQRNPADLRGLAALGELARVDPAVSWPAARQAVLRAFWQALKEHDPA